MFRIFKFNLSKLIFLGIVTNILSTSIANAMENEQKNDLTKEWILKINQLDENTMGQEERTILNQFVNSLGRLGGYVGVGGAFCYNTSSNLAGLAGQLDAIRAFKNEFSQAMTFTFKDSESLANNLNSSELVQEFLIAQCPMAAKNGLFCNWQTPWLQCICACLVNTGKILYNRCSKKVPADNEFLDRTLNHLLATSESTFNNFSMQLQSFACNTQIKHSIILWVSSAYYIYSDYKKIDSVKSVINETLNIINDHTDKDGIFNQTKIREILKEIENINDEISTYLSKGESSLKKFIEYADGIEFATDRSQFINTRLPIYIMKTQTSRQTIESKLNDLVKNTGELQNAINNRIIGCRENKETCDVTGIGQVILAAANIYGAVSTWSFGNIGSTCTYTILACCNVGTAKVAYDNKCKLEEQINTLGRIAQHYSVANKIIKDKETALLQSLADFFERLNSHLLEDKTSGFSWD